MNFSEEHALETYKSLISISTEALKALQLVNGGAVVALLAYLGQASDRATAVEVKCPMAFFVLGPVTATAAFIPSYLTQLALYQEDRRNDQYKGVRDRIWLNVALVLAVLSLAAFALVRWEPSVHSHIVLVVPGNRYPYRDPEGSALPALSGPGIFFSWDHATYRMLT